MAKSKPEPPHIPKVFYFFLLIVKPKDRITFKMDKKERQYYFKRMALIFPVPYKWIIDFKKFK